MTKLFEKQQVRFLVAGSLNTAIDFVLLNIMTLALGAPVLLANSVSVVFGICLSYVLNHFFVFRYPDRVTVKRFLEFFAITGFSSLVIQNVIIWLFEMLFGTSFGRSLLFLGSDADNNILAINFAKAVAVLVGLVWNFAFYRLVVFSSRRAAPSKEAEADGRSGAEGSRLGGGRAPSEGSADGGGETLG
ncbi:MULTISPECIES: GtrA family protein [unclassified Rathayibacter]|uniref:GtrA family protein n=1 Tax=unclassified Rathayibacter TaxID=2609250 RepID=UPI0009ECB5F0|nr:MULTISPECIES: GtrA family protein [unclassified Rathayibacter]